MNTPAPAVAPTTDHSVALSRIFRASREQLWRAWTDPAQIARWFGMSEDYRTQAAIELVVGGAMRISMVSAVTGTRCGMSGTVLAIEPTRKLVYTWLNSEGGAPAGRPTRVTAEFRDHPQGCELVLVHEQFTGTAERDGHLAGWNAITDRLRQHLAAAAGDGQKPVRSMASWFDIPVLDLARACAFYRAVLGVEIAASSLPGEAVAVLPHANGSIGGLLVTVQDNTPSERGGVLLYLNCEGRLDEAIAAAGSLGGSVIRPRHALGPHGFRAIIRDSEGNRLALHSH